MRHSFLSPFQFFMIHFLKWVGFSFSLPSHHLTPWLLLLLFCHQVVSVPMWPHELKHTRLLCPWNFPGQNTGMGCHSLLQGIFPTQRSNLCLYVSCISRELLYHWHHLGRPFTAIVCYKKSIFNVSTLSPHSFNSTLFPEFTLVAIK